MKIIKNTLMLIAGLCTVLVFVPVLTVFSSGDAKAEFPSKPIKVYVGFKPGGRTDLIARMVAKHITDNKMVASHIRTIFDFSDYNEPGIKWRHCSDQNGKR